MAAVTAALVLMAKPGVLFAAWKELSYLVALKGDPIQASSPVISGHELEELDAMAPQAQAERLLERAINRYLGATALIADRIEGWHGKIKLDGTLNGLFVTALDSNDLRVRAAAIEIYLAAHALDKTPESLERVIARCQRQAAGRPNELWVVGLLGNRGVEPERALDFLLKWVDDPNVETRHWAVEGLAMLGTDATIVPLLTIFHDDPSAFIRERAACSLAQSGMLTRRQRWTALPQLIRFADDPALDDKTRAWVFQALQDISGERLPDDTRDWKARWAKEPWPTGRSDG